MINPKQSAHNPSYWQRWVLVAILFIALLAHSPASANVPTAGETPKYTLSVSVEIQPNQQDEGTRITWTVMDETFVVGYNLYRQTAGQAPYTLLTEETIMAANPGTLSYATYSVDDTRADPQAQNNYILEFIQIDGTTYEMFYTYTPPSEPAPVENAPLMRVMIPMVMH